MWRLLFFLSVGDEGNRRGGTDHNLVPATPEPTPRGVPLRGARASTMAGTP
jgi:hypothetical protein